MNESSGYLDRERPGSSRSRKGYLDLRRLVRGGVYVADMTRYRLLPSDEQAVVLTEYCRQARYIWNLAVEQQRYWQPGRRAPGFNEQCAQLTSIRAEYDWLAAGSHTVQQQALRDFAQAMRNFFRRNTPPPDMA